MNILTVFTGGTIGCSPINEENILTLDTTAGTGVSAQEKFLITHYKKNLKSPVRNKINFEIMEPLCTLSEDMTVSKWMILVKSLQQIDFTKYDGIVITHGTDTLAYSAAFFGIVLAGINLPVVFVSANKNLYDPYTNGHQNFEAAVDFICNVKNAGVYVAYAYERDKTVFYLGTRIKQSDVISDRYESIGGVDYGFMKDGRFTQTTNITPISVCGGKSILHDITDLKSLVILLQPYVGLDYNKILLDPHDTRAVLHAVYHSYTACTDTEEAASILTLEEICRGENIMLCVAPFSTALLQGGEQYESTNKIKQGSIYFFCGQSIECAYAKLLIAVNLYSDIHDVKKFLDKTFFYENIDVDYV